MEKRSAFAASRLVLRVLLCFTIVMQQQCNAVYNSVVNSPCRTDLTMDEAMVQFVSMTNASLLVRNEQCHKCSFVQAAETGRCARLWSVHKWEFKVQVCDENSHCSIVAHAEQVLGEKGRYDLTLSQDEEQFKLHVHETQAPQDSLIPIYVALAVLIVVATFFWWFPWIWERLLGFPLPKPEHSNAASGRLHSLDTVRGLAMCLMIFVNYGGGGYWFFDHADWNGVTIADFVFPWFMWIMGVSIDLSLTSLRKKGASRRELFKKVTIRSLKLLALGLFVNNGVNLPHWRITGVLQYFAFSYFVVCCVIILCMPQTEAEVERLPNQAPASSHDFDVPLLPDADHSDASSCTVVRWTVTWYDFWPYRTELLGISVWFFAYVLCTHILASDGCPAGYLGPGGLAEHSDHRHCTGGLHRDVDVWMLTNSHSFQFPTCQRLYDCVSYDPEGIVGSFNAVVLTYLGVIAGRTLKHYRSDKGRIIRWLAWAASYLLFTGALCEFSQNDGAIPVNKNLWSISFVTLSAGSGLVLLSAIYIVVDVAKVWTGAPFSYMGMNSILIYVGSIVLHHFFPFSYSTRNTHGHLLRETVMGTSCWVVIAIYLYHKNFFWKV